MQVTITDVHIPFLSLTWLITKAMLAALPAFLLACMVGGSILAAFASLGLQ